MWKIVYNISDNRVISVNGRGAQAGESVVHMDPTKCAWANVYPDRYKVENDALVERPEWAQEEADQEAAQTAAIAALQARIADIEAAQSTADLKRYTVAQATNWITHELTAADTLAKLRVTTGNILIRMLPYILPK